MSFDFLMPVKLITGRGCIAANSQEFGTFGGNCLIVTSGSAAKKSGALADVTDTLVKAGILYTLYDRVEPNPSLVGAKEAGDLGRANGVAFVVGIGGGSALDAAKAAAVFAANEMDAMDIYKLDWKTPALPLIAVGTTAGTGSEVAPYAVMTTPAGKKQSFGSVQIYPRIAFGDAGYTDSLPLLFTISTALDALSHALEGYYALSANLLSDLLAREAVRILYPQLKALRHVKTVDEVTPEMRDALYYASVLAGFTLAHCGTCYCHSMGYFLSERHGLPHGTACAVFLPDFTSRAGRLMPEKASALFRDAGCTQEELCSLIGELNPHPTVSLTAEEITTMVDAQCRGNNFLRTAPKGYTAQEAIQLMTSLFGA